MKQVSLVCDTSPLLYLGRIGQVQLLAGLFEAVFAPEEVVLELDMGRLLRADTLNPRLFKWIKMVSVPQSSIEQLPANRLGAGERAVIAFAQNQSAMIVGMDDRQARQFAKQLGLQAIGTVGVLVNAKRQRLIPSVRVLLDAVRKEGCRIGDDVYSEALQLADE